MTHSSYNSYLLCCLVSILAFISWFQYNFFIKNKSKDFSLSINFFSFSKLTLIYLISIHQQFFRSMNITYTSLLFPKCLSPIILSSSITCLFPTIILKPYHYSSILSFSLLYLLLKLLVIILPHVILG